MLDHDGRVLALAEQPVNLVPDGHEAAKDGLRERSALLVALKLLGLPLSPAALRCKGVGVEHGEEPGVLLAGGAEMQLVEGGGRGVGPGLEPGAPLLRGGGPGAGRGALGAGKGGEGLEGLTTGRLEGHGLTARSRPLLHQVRGELILEVEE